MKNQLETLEAMDNYIFSLEPIKREWIHIMINFMRETFPELEEAFEHKMPTYKGEGYYIAFAAQKNYFSFYVEDVNVLSAIKDMVPSASLGKGCARIKYTQDFAIEALMDACKQIVDEHKSKQSPAVSDMKALKKWADVPPNVKRMLVENTFCLNCGVTTIVDYGIHDDRFGLVLKGSCKKCGSSVARFIED